MLGNFDNRHDVCRSIHKLAVKPWLLTLLTEKSSALDTNMFCMLQTLMHDWKMKWKDNNTSGSTKIDKIKTARTQAIMLIYLVLHYIVATTRNTSFNSCSLLQNFFSKKYSQKKTPVNSFCL